jgi:hypothetical protein
VSPGDTVYFVNVLCLGDLSQPPVLEGRLVRLQGNLAVVSFNASVTHLDHSLYSSSRAVAEALVREFIAAEKRKLQRQVMLLNAKADRVLSTLDQTSPS